MIHESVYEIRRSVVNSLTVENGKVVVVDESRYPLLEQPAPVLCADRVEYCLRDALSSGLVNRAEVADFLAHLVVVGGRMVVDDVGAARWMG